MHDVQHHSSDCEARSVFQQAHVGFAGKIVLPVSSAHPGQIEPGSGSLRELPGTRDEISVDVGLSYVRDPKMVFSRGPQISIERSIGIDDQRLSALRAADQVAGLCQFGIKEPFEDHRLFDRLLSRRTNLSPDQVWSTAQTLTSTSPSGKPSSRTTFSVKSVSTPELIFAQDIQTFSSSSNASACRGISPACS